MLLLLLDERKYHDNMLNHELFFLLISKYCLKNVEVSDNVQYRYIYHFNWFFWPKPMSSSPILFLCQNYGDQPGNGEYLNYFLLFSCPQHQWDKQSSSFLLWYLAFGHKHITFLLWWGITILLVSQKAVIYSCNAKHNYKEDYHNVVLRNVLLMFSLSFIICLSNTLLYFIFYLWKSNATTIQRFSSFSGPL